MASRLSTTQKEMAFRLRVHGWSLAEIARQIGCHATLVGTMLRRGQGRTGVADEWSPRQDRLSIAEREHILLSIGRGESLRSIARALGRAPSTISREVAANGGRPGMGHGERTSAHVPAHVDPSRTSCALGRCWPTSRSNCRRCGRPRRLRSVYGWSIQTSHACR